MHKHILFTVAKLKTSVSQIKPYFFPSQHVKLHMSNEQPLDIITIGTSRKTVNHKAVDENSEATLRFPFLFKIIV